MSRRGMTVRQYRPGVVLVTTGIKKGALNELLVVRKNTSGGFVLAVLD